MEKFDMLKEQETLHFKLTNLGPHMKFQKIKSNYLYRQGNIYKLMLLHQFLPAMDQVTWINGAENNT